MTSMAAGIAAEEFFNDYELAQTIYLSIIDMCKSAYPTRNYTNIPQQRLDGMKPKLRAIQQKKNAEYWQEHTEEKTQLEKRIKEIDLEITSLNRRYFSVI